MKTLVVVIEIEVPDKKAGLEYLEKLARSVKGYQYPVRFDDQACDEDLDPIWS